MNNDIDYASRFSANLAELMAAHNITQKDLAVSLSFTPAEVSNAKDVKKRLEADND